jgi:hypothetical protein
MSRFNYFNFLLMGIMQTSPVSGEPTLAVRPGKEAMEQWVLTSLADDLEQKKPPLIVMKREWKTDEGPNESFDFMQWFKHDARMMGIFGHYQLVDEQEICADPELPDMTIRCSFKIFARKHSGG